MPTNVLTDEDARTYLDIGIFPVEVVKLRWPNVTAEEADYILWEFTPFPIVEGIHDIANAVASISVQELVYAMTEKRWEPIHVD